MYDNNLEALRLTAEIENARASAAVGRARQAEAHAHMQQDAITANWMEALTGYFEGLAMTKAMRRGELHDWLSDRAAKRNHDHGEY